jgi:hypothetical protein
MTIRIIILKLHEFPFSFYVSSPTENLTTHGLPHQQERVEILLFGENKPSTDGSCRLFRKLEELSNMQRHCTNPIIFTMEISKLIFNSKTEDNIHGAIIKGCKSFNMIQILFLVITEDMQ